jgi:hypothetical protein
MTRRASLACAVFRRAGYSAPARSRAHQRGCQPSGLGTVVGDRRGGGCGEGNEAGMTDDALGRGAPIVPARAVESSTAGSPVKSSRAKIPPAIRKGDLTMQRISKGALAAVVLVLSCPAPVAAQYYTAALGVIRPLAEQGDARAQSELGRRYDSGEDVPEDHVAAVKWYRKAAEQGYAEAQNNLGLAFLEGEGVPQDYIAAHMWFNLSAAQGNADGLIFRNHVAKRMTPSQIEEAQKLAREWKPK